MILTKWAPTSSKWGYNSIYHITQGLKPQLSIYQSIYIYNIYDFYITPFIANHRGPLCMGSSTSFELTFCLGSFGTNPSADRSTHWTSGTGASFVGCGCPEARGMFFFCVGKTKAHPTRWFEGEFLLQKIRDDERWWLMTIFWWLRMIGWYFLANKWDFY